MEAYARFFILGISGAGLMHYVNNFRQTSQTAVEQAEYKPQMRQLIINNLRALLIEKNINQSGEFDSTSIHGICSLIKSPEAVYGVEKIEMDLLNIKTKENPSLTDNKRWQHFFQKSEWQIAQDDYCRRIDSNFEKNKLSYCFSYGAENASPEFYAIARIIPLSFLTENSQHNMQEIDITSEQLAVLDAKKVFFHLETRLMSAASFNTDSNSDNSESVNSAGSYISSQSSITWANDVGECVVTLEDGTQTIARFSGTGTGTSIDTVLFNNPSFIQEDGKKLQLLSLIPNAIQSGQIDGDLNISTVTRLNVKMSCTAHTFKCKKRMDDQNYEAEKTFDDLSFAFNIYNKTNQKIPIQAIKFTLKNNNNEMDNTQADHTLADTTFKGIYTGESNPAGSDIPADIPSSYGVIEGNVTGVSQYCKDICNDYTPGEENTYFYPSIRIVGEDNKKFEKNYNYGFISSTEVDTSNRVHCTVCHMKSCNRFGLNTFGPYKEETREFTTEPQIETIYGLADEPLDGQVPECAVENKYDEIRKIPSKILELTTTNTNNSGCTAIAMGISDENSFTDFSKNAYNFTDCTEKLPVLCFVDGYYVPAMDIDKNNPNSPKRPITKDFASAHEACLKQGREIGSYQSLGFHLVHHNVINGTGPNLQGGFNIFDTIIAKLIEKANASFNFNDIFGDSGTDQTDSSKKFDFINNAERGMFLAPPPDHKVDFISTSTQNIINALKNRGYNKIWIAMESDGDEAAIASLPWALEAKNHPLSVYYGVREGDSAQRSFIALNDTDDNRNDITPLKKAVVDENETVIRKADNNSKYFALIYDIRWRGILPVQKETELPYVCKSISTGQFFITLDENAPSSIKNQKGKPETGAAKCAAASGIFVPPESSMDWVKLMLELNPNDEHHPFPKPNATRSWQNGTVWQDSKRSKDYLQGNETNKYNVGQAVYPIGELSWKDIKKDGKPIKLPGLKKAWVSLKYQGNPTSTADKYKENSVRINRFKSLSELNTTAGSIFNAPSLSSTSIAHNCISYKGQSQSCTTSGSIILKNIGSASGKQNIGSTSGKYYKLCVKNNLPHSFISVTNDCPLDTKQLDLASTDTTVSSQAISNGHLYMSKWLYAWKKK